MVPTEPRMAPQPPAAPQVEAASVATPFSVSTAGRADGTALGSPGALSSTASPSSAAPATAAPSSAALPMEGASAAVVYEASSVLADLSRNESQSPSRAPAAPDLEPVTPAKVVPPKVPPSTPMNIAEAAQADSVQAMSPSVVHIPPDMQMRPGAIPDSPMPVWQLGTSSPDQAAPGVTFESSPPAPGVIYETQAQQTAAGLL
eukprot:UN0665